MKERKQVIEMFHNNRVSAKLLLALAATATALVAVIVTSSGAFGASPSRAPVPGAASPARTISLNESASLHLTSKHGFTLNEQGAAHGTLKGTIYVHLTIVSTKKVTAEVNIYPSTGSISGSASAGYRREGANGRFSGSLAITKGSGAYSHARGSGLSFSGTIAKSNDAIAVRVSGRASV